jgi:hypothetical protein
MGRQGIKDWKAALGLVLNGIFYIRLDFFIGLIKINLIKGSPAREFKEDARGLFTNSKRWLFGI